jgi:hypothetical protein
MTHDEAMKAIGKLTPRERERMGQIMLSTAKILEGMLSCAGPDDAKIAACCAISAVFGIATAPSLNKMQNVVIEFVVEALIARRSYAQWVEEKQTGFQPDAAD